MAATDNSGFYKKMGAAASALVIAASLGATPVIKKWEGRWLKTDRDIAGVLTYCDGETLNADLNKTYTPDQCDALTQKRALQFAQGVAGMLDTAVSQETFESLIVFSYNVGLENLRTSTALRQINAGNVAEGCRAILRFACITVAAGKGDRSAPLNAPGADCRTPTFNKQFVRGLYNRRNDEMQKCLAGIEMP